mmetsp:Transcript_31118/g.53249  ORF Transcript_31118/g.53249 Transcript_31118/m.53249 type:complete len:121 (-) Transcript_31118:201-563(-)
MSSTGGRLRRRKARVSSRLFEVTGVILSNLPESNWPARVRSSRERRRKLGKGSKVSAALVEAAAQEAYRVRRREREGLEHRRDVSARAHVGVHAAAALGAGKELRARAGGGGGAGRRARG